MHHHDMTSAKAAARKQDWEGARRFAEAALASADTPEQRLDTLLLLADIHEGAERMDAALAALKTALEEFPESARAWNNLGILCRGLGRLDEARQALEEAYRRDPENPAILISLASIHLKRSDPGTALSIIDLALELAPNHPAAHANRSLILAVFGRIEEAEESLRLAVLYGFSEPDPILDRLEQLKRHRASILDAHVADSEEEKEEEGGLP